MRLFAPLTAAAVFVLGTSSGFAQADAESGTPDEVLAPTGPVEDLVRKFGYPSKGLAGAELARSLLLEEGMNAEVLTLIENLSGGDFAIREKAVAKLIGISAPIDGALWKARDGAEPGLAIMLDRTLETRQGLRSLERTGYLFQEIARTPIGGLAVPVARTASVCDVVRDLEIVRAGVAAVIATVESVDKVGLESLVAEGSRKTQIAAVAGLSVLAIRAGEGLPDTDDVWSKLGVSYALVALGDGRAAAHLVDLLEAEPVLLRAEAGRLLEASSGHPEHLVGPYDALSARLEKIKWWRSWIENSNGSPEISAVAPDGGWRGVTLVSAGGKGGTRVLEIGMAGSTERIFSSGVGGISGVPRSASLADDGRTWILTSAGSDASSLHLFDKAGRWLWSAEGVAGAEGFAVLPGGNYLLSDSKKPVLNEFDWLGKRVGTREIGGVASGLQMLPGGRILAVLSEEKAVVEIGEDGSEMWKFGNLEGVKFARRLANGHHLIVHAEGLTEYGGDGKPVWKVEATRSGVWGEILSAARRPGGNTYLGTDLGLREITPGLRVLNLVTGGQINSLESF